MASLAINALRLELFDRENPRIALVGTGTMTVKCAAHLRQGKACELIFVSRTESKAAILANRFDGESRSLDEFLNDPGRLDGIVTATAARGTVFGGDFLSRIDDIQAPLICIDLAVPRDFSEEFDASDMTVVVDIAALRTREQRNLRKRFVKVGNAGEIVEEEVDRFFAERIEVSLKPIFRQSYQESVAMAEEAFTDLFNSRITVLSQEERQTVLRLVTRLIGHTCFQPAKALSDQLADRAEYLLSDDVIVASRESA